MFNIAAFNPSTGYSLEFGADYILVSRDGVEVIYWDRQEWLDDPDLLITILRVIAAIKKGEDIQALINQARHPEVKEL